MGAEASEHAATLKLKPVIRKPTIGGGTPIAAGIKLPAAPAAAKPATPADVASTEAPAMEQLKTVTQRLKGATQQIPQQAILRKTGIIADQALTDAQKQAAKARTARISLSDAMGVAPVKNEAAPMKTIRIKRPSAAAPTPATVAPVIAPEAEAAKPEEKPAAPTVDETTVTQRKTLKVSRPGAPGRPVPKFGVKKPGAPAAEKTEDAAPAGDVPEIADIPDLPPVAAMPAQEKEGVEDVPAFVGILGLIVQVAACIVIGVLGWWLFQDTQVSTF
jgi:hypothetical protein